MEYRSYINKIKISAILFMLLSVLSIASLGISLELVLCKSSSWGYFVAIFIVLLLCLVVLYMKAYRNQGKMVFSPFEIEIGHGTEFEDIYFAIDKFAKNCECFKFSENSAFFRFENKYTVRVVLYKTTDFDKKEYDEEKKKINRKANKLYNIPREVSINNARKQMRVNLIISDNVNQALYNYISKDAEILLGRVEGIINLVISSDKLIVPFLKPTVSLYAITRYNDIIDMFLKILKK